MTTPELLDVIATVTSHTSSFVGEAIIADIISRAEHMASRRAEGRVRDKYDAIRRKVNDHAMTRSEGRNGIVG